MQIGFIGLGNMGGPIAMNLIKAGHNLVVHDINPNSALPHQKTGASWASTPKEVAAQTDLIFTSLPGPKEVEAVATGPDGILEGIKQDAIYIDASTNSPTVVKRISEKIISSGASMLDAPVSGGPVGAEAGTLAIIVGGNESTFKTVQPILETIGTGVTYVGEIGSGTIAKLVHNATSFAARIAVQEGMVLAVKSGVSPSNMLKVLQEAAFGKQVLLTHHIPELVFKGDFDNVRFALGLSHKDVSLALELAEEMNVPLEMAEKAKLVIEEGMSRGWAGKDNLSTFMLYEERAGIEVRE
ncbi:MAG: 3-hydroxyisobutyrate dehydrogenase [Chloroflexi bacterium]|nr:3-hydroxyisobutyrate dehydrogenase [Chloroflexota bacterium]|tara:strand:- start:7736 stop:8629 length:894 start_codon:yes stop_codon:yes gene_type:complete